MSMDRGRVLPLFFTPTLLRRLRMEAPYLVDQLDKEFSWHRLRADYLLRLRCPETPLLNHWEFQKYPDSSMSRRVVGYQAAGFVMHEAPLISFVVYINGPGKAARSGTALKVISTRVGPLSRTGWVEFYLPELVRTWPAQLDSPLGIVLRCLVSEVRRGMLVRCFKELQQSGLDHPTCRVMAEMLAYLIDKKDGGDGGGYLDILQEDLTMLEAEGSLFYQFGVKKGVEKGVEKGVDQERQEFRAWALDACRQRFAGDEPGLLVLAERLKLVPDARSLASFISRLSMARDLQDALALLPAPAANGHHNGG